MSDADEVALSPIAPSSRDVAAGMSSLPSAPADTSLVRRRSGTSSPKIPARLAKPPKDSRVYKVAMAYIAMRANGIPISDISEQLGMPKDTIRTYVKRAHRKGWLNRSSFEDHEDQVDVTLREATIRNVEAFLNDGDKDMTIEAAKGLGVFKNHSAVKVESNTNTNFVLRVQVEMPKGAEASSPIQIRPGSVGGMPAVEGEVIGTGDSE